jgi:hypothetical protein
MSGMAAAANNDSGRRRRHPRAHLCWRQKHREISGVASDSAAAADGGIAPRATAARR